MIAIAPMTAIYRNESLYNLNPEGLGKSIERTKAPFVVLKPVLTTMARETASSSLSSFGRRARIIFVPQNKKCFARPGAIDVAERSNEFNDSSIAGTLETGTDSPWGVSAA